MFVAGVLGERFIAPHTDIEVANTNAREAAKFACGLDLNAIVAKTRLRIYNLWTEVSRLAEALDKHGLLDAGEIARAARMPPVAPPKKQDSVVPHRKSDRPTRSRGAWRVCAAT